MPDAQISRLCNVPLVVFSITTRLLISALTASLADEEGIANAQRSLGLGSEDSSRRYR